MSASKKKKARREAALKDERLTEKQKQEQKQAQVHKRNVIIGVIVGVIIALLVIFLLVWRTGIFGRRTTALTVHGENYSVADVNYYYYQALNSTYSNQQYYAQIYAQMGITDFGDLFDPSISPKDQYVDTTVEHPQTYHQYFLEAAKTNLAQTVALCDAAKAAGYTLSADAQAELDESIANLDTQVKNNNCGSRTAYLKLVYGQSMTESVFLKNLEMSTLAYEYSQSVTSAMGNYSDAELEAYYEENPALLTSYDYNYVYFSGSVPATTDPVTGEEVEATDEEKAAAMAEAKIKADAVANAVGTSTEDGVFTEAALAQGATASPRKAILGSNISTMPFCDWLTDTARKTGDITVSESEGAGYYVVQYLDRARDDMPTIDVRHILVATNLTDDPETKDVDERLDETDKTVIVAKNKAEAILNEYLAGEKTAEAFGELAEKYSEDGRGSDGALSAAGGLYTSVHVDQMVKNFNDWIFDGSRKAGDTDLVLTEFGWHVMYFQGSHEAAWKAQAESAKKSDEQTKWAESVEEGYDAVEKSGFSQVGVR